MGRNFKIALAVIAGLLIFGAIELVGINSQNSATNGGTSINTAPNLDAIQQKDVALTITYTGKEFEPNLATIAAYSSVRVRNRSVRLLKFMSDPYGLNTDEPDLNLGEILPGESFTFRVTQKGTWGYYNTYDSTEIGQLIVN